MVNTIRLNSRLVLRGEPSEKKLPATSTSAAHTRTKFSEVLATSSSIDTDVAWSLDLRHQAAAVCSFSSCSRGMQGGSGSPPGGAVVGFSSVQGGSFFRCRRGLLLPCKEAPARHQKAALVGGGKAAQKCDPEGPGGRVRQRRRGAAPGGGVSVGW